MIFIMLIMGGLNNTYIIKIIIWGKNVCVY
jgi:hypothetical protein